MLLSQLLQMLLKPPKRNGAAKFEPCGGRSCKTAAVAETAEPMVVQNPCKWRPLLLPQLAMGCGTCPNEANHAPCAIGCCGLCCCCC